MAKEQPRTAGWGTCPLCGMEDQPFKVSGKEHLYFICQSEADGGCNHQLFARGSVSDTLLAKKITRWKSKEERKKWLAEVEAPEPDQGEVDEEIEEAVNLGEIEAEPAAEPPPPSPKRTVPRTTPPKPKLKRPQPPQLAKAKPRKLLGGLLEW